MPRYSSIEWLRVFAAFGVCIFHYFPTYESLQGSLSLIRVLAPKGFFGVDLFFVISGFVMATAASGVSASWKTVLRLIVRRAWRLYLPYWMTIPLAVLAVVCHDASVLSQFKVLDTVFLTTLSHQSLLIPATWFLPYLLYFSVVFALSLCLPPKLRGRIYWVVLGALCLKALWAPARGDLILHPFAIEFLAGVLLYQTDAGRVNQRLVCLGLVILAVASFALGVHLVAENNGFRALTYGCSAWCVVTLLIKGELRWGVPLPGFVRTLADASYAVFLLHGPLLALGYALGVIKFVQGWPPVWRELAFAGGLALVVAMACAFHACLERPLARKTAAWMAARTAGWAR